MAKSVLTLGTKGGFPCSPGSATVTVYTRKLTMCERNRIALFVFKSLEFDFDTPSGIASAVKIC